MARRKKDESFVPLPTPERQLTHPSGWCIDADHEGCRYQFNHGKCGCTCHTLSKTQKTQTIKEEVAFVADSDDPRPWVKK